MVSIAQTQQVLSSILNLSNPIIVPIRQQMKHHVIMICIVIIQSLEMTLHITIPQIVQVAQIVRILQFQMKLKLVTKLPHVKLPPMKQLVMLMDQAAIL